MRRIATVHRLTQVLNAVVNGITVQDPTGDLVFVNDAAATMMGFASGQEAIRAGGLAILDKFDYFDEANRPLKPSELPGRLALLGQLESLTVGFRPKGTQGAVRWSVIKAAPVRDRRGQVVLAVNVIEDITLLKSSERKLKEANLRITNLLGQALDPSPKRVRK